MALSISSRVGDTTKLVIRGTFLTAVDEALEGALARRRSQSESWTSEPRLWADDASTCAGGSISSIESDAEVSGRWSDMEDDDSSDEERSVAAASGEAEAPVDGRTTLILRNGPEAAFCSDICAILDAQGFACSYDLAYTPINFKKMRAFGYTFVNFASAAEAARAKAHFDGFRWLFDGAAVTLVADWSDPHQGLECHIQRLRNCPVMHKLVPDSCKPRLFRHGERVAFPAATERIQAPRDVRRFFAGC